MIVDLSWTEFKIVASNKARVRYIDRDTFYKITYTDEGGVFECSVLQDSGADQIDFETNYQSLANQSYALPVDSDGAPLSRVKMTTSGWAYQLHSIELETSKLDSVVELKEDNTSWGFASIKYYQLIDGVETLMSAPTQGDLDTNCVKTIVDWEPTFDYEIMGGFLKQISVPSSDVRLWVIGVPDVPAIYGGSKLFISSINLRYLGTEEGIRVDGRAPKYLAYNATNHTNKIRIMLRHPVGMNHKLCFTMEIFKA